MAKDWMDKLIDAIFDEAWMGKRGEKLTERELKLVKLLGRKGKTLRNVYVPKENGETSEIDVMYITQKGIFVFESKNYSGWIFGDEKSTYWTVSLPNGQKNRFYNPVKQNRTHLKWLQKYVGPEVPLFSIIVFSERCELKKIEMDSEDIKVIKRDRTYAAVRDIWDSHDDVVSESDLSSLYEKLKILTNVDDAVKAAHIANIKSRYPSKTETQKTQTIPDEKPAVIQPDALNTEKAEELLCPRCGSPLILRVAKKGENAGKQFYGCSAFPKCRYIQNL